MHLKLFTYMERMHLSYQQAVETPWPEIEYAFVVWSIQAARDKLGQERSL